MTREPGNLLPVMVMRERVGRGAPMSQEVLVRLPLGARAEGNSNRADGVSCRRRAVQCQIFFPVISHAVGSNWRRNNMPFR
jgi:hypothetical protein